MTRPGQSLHSFLEAPFFDVAGDLWLSDVAGGRIFRLDHAGVWEIAHHYDGAPHATHILADGRVLVADYFCGLGQIRGNAFTLISEGLPDVPFAGLSDMAPGPRGDVWITDSGRSSLTSPTGRLWHFDESEKLRLVLDTVPYSNGLAVSPDGAMVYIAATRANQIWRLASTLPDTGSPMAGVFLQLSGGLGPDGLATNALGWLAIAQAQAGRAYVTDVLGDAIAEIRLPEGLWTTSVVFAPDNPLRLFIVEAQFGVIYVVDLPA
jgi:gluconolactonase